ncbi:hypothetical protein G7081_06035 [Vagococcus coleopterorum]|uniref:Uncharacterized protein n=1 Tax=Vagococcus coleopterorum TaxID=2714946 RepID=A0A6G8ANU7_9ENTE|nr:hypothetical protein [Vagococcus coleopterorum]QIL46667.1 hypothetical protein G7081_06035 [Vagococcus coleopterorum]
MKKLITLSITLVSCLFLSGCSKEQNIEGKWKATDAYKQKINLSIDPTTITMEIKKHEKEMEYKEISNSEKNNMKYFVFEIDKQQFTIVFPNKRDANTALFIKNNSNHDPFSGALTYTMNREKFPNYEQTAKQYFKN